MKRPFSSLFSNIPFVVSQTFVAGIVLGFILSYSSFRFTQSPIGNANLIDVNLPSIKKSQNLIEKIQTLVNF